MVRAELIQAILVGLALRSWAFRLARRRRRHGRGAHLHRASLVSGMADNVVEPPVLGRGVDVPMPVIFVGALGVMAWNGIVGMFVGATLLALAWQISTGWVEANPDANIPPRG
jgi:hypothetical protein